MLSNPIAYGETFRIMRPNRPASPRNGLDIWLGIALGKGGGFNDALR